MKIWRVTSRFDVNDSIGKAAMSETLFPLIAVIDNPYEQDRYVTRLAGRLGVTEERLRANAGRTGPRRLAQAAVRVRRSPAGKMAASPGDGGSAAPEASMDSGLEEHLLTLVLTYQELREYAVDLPEEVFVDPTLRALFTAWKATDTIERLRDLVDPELAQRADQLASIPLPPSDQMTRVADVSECVHRLHERHLRGLKAQEQRLRPDIDSGAVPQETRSLIDQRSLETNERLRQLFTRHS